MPSDAAPKVEYFYDPESRNWGFHVDQPRIVGGGDATLAGAERHAASAIAFALKWERADRRARIARSTLARTRRAGLFARRQRAWPVQRRRNGRVAR